MKFNWFLMSVILNALLFVEPGGCYRIPTEPDNCTCKTSEGIYSLFPLAVTGGKPRFTETGFQPNPNYYYSYNPCVPYNLTSKKGNCTNVALCRYNEDTQPVYNDIGEQRDVQCDINDGKVALIYPIRWGPFKGRESRLNLECNDDPEAKPKFVLIKETYLIFQLTSNCGCPNKCVPPTSTAPPRPGPFSTSSSEPETASTRTGTTSSPSTGSNSYWELEILLPSLLGPLVVVILFVCLWMRLSVIQRAQLCRCCQCYEQNRDPLREERNVFVTEKSALVRHENGRAVEHADYPGVEGKLNEPVQEEGRDVKGENKLPGKDNRTAVT